MLGVAQLFWSFPSVQPIAADLVHSSAFKVIKLSFFSALLFVFFNWFWRVLWAPLFVISSEVAQLHQAMEGATQPVAQDEGVQNVSSAND